MPQIGGSMSDQTVKISFSSKNRRVLIHKSTLRALGMPQYIRFLLNKRRKCVAVQVCEAIDRDCFKVPELKPEDVYEISSVNFVKMVYTLGEWNINSSYRVCGEAFSEKRLVEFDLTEAVTITEEEFEDDEQSAG